MASGGTGVRLRVFGQTDAGRVRHGNEDAFLVANLATGDRWTGSDPAEWPVADRGVVLAVSDGMGGAKAGEVASAICVDGLYRGMLAASRELGQRGGGLGGSAACPREPPLSDDLGGSAACPREPPSLDEIEALRRVVERVSHEVREAATQSDRRGMGATLTVVIVLGGMAYVAEVGDSRAYLLRSGSLCQVTRDQSYVQMLVDAGAITPEAADQSPKKNLIMQVMGQREDLMVALSRFELRQGDRLLLCSDGLSNMVKDNQILAIASPPTDVGAAGAALVAQANESGGDDNITVVLADVSGDGLAPPAPGEGANCSEVVDTVQEFKL